MTPLQHAIDEKIQELLLKVGRRNETQEEFTSRLSYITGNAPGTFDFWNEDGKTPLRLVCRPPQDILDDMKDHKVDLEKNQIRLIIALTQLGANPLQDTDTLSAICNVASINIGTIINAFAEREQAGGHIRNEKGANPIQAMVPTHLGRVIQLLMGDEMSEHAKGWLYEPHPLTGRDVLHETLHHMLSVKRPVLTDHQQKEIKQLIRLMVNQAGSSNFMHIKDLFGKTAEQSLFELIDIGKVPAILNDPAFVAIKADWDKSHIERATPDIQAARPRTRL